MREGTLVRELSGEEINPRHAAALALVGWYLMVPPLKGDSSSGYRADYDAPLSQWTVLSPFDSASPCDTQHRRDVDDGASAMKKAPKGSFDWAVAQKLTQSQCIATDDPRLRGK